MFKNKLYIVFTFLLPQFVFAQVDLSQYVINSWGSFYDNGSINISASSGEAMIPTVKTADSSLWLTQGFQQPEFTFSGLNVFASYHNASCFGNNDGNAISIVTGGAPGYTYLWSNGKTSANNDSLSKGTYTVVVTDASGTSKSMTLTISEEPVTCGEIRIYHGFTPNGDNYNDTWKVSGILNFPDNDVVIYNRWGDKVWEAKQYDNYDIVWKGENMNGNAVPDGTYFFIFRYGDKKEKGWVEITR